MTVGLSFAYRNNIPTIRRMLASIVPLVDEVVAVATGSTDGTRRLVAEALQALDARGGHGEVIEHQWRQDFSAMRNAGWSRLGSDWLIAIDSDEVWHSLPDTPRELASRADASGVDGVIVPFHNAGLVLPALRMVRRDVGWVHEGPVWEALVPARRVRVAQTDDAWVEHLRRGASSDHARNQRIAAYHQSRDGAAAHWRVRWWPNDDTNPEYQAHAAAGLGLLGLEAGQLQRYVSGDRDAIPRLRQGSTSVLELGAGIEG